ncbi:MAG: RagB/SusD family nutrient uptake outer membrane protein [Bacteroidaceae bacterium]|nr:RagB/SusD family nutrient uptake outer membrane protein [Bacteroidaceae bacterium]
MKKKKIYQSALGLMKPLAGALLLATSSQVLLSSCDDFLSIEPQNDIVLEKYWKEEKDVNSVMNTCYAQLESSNCLNRMVVWGEMRSDNMTTGSGTSYALQQVMKENILETNDYTNWQSFYQVINYCNTVLYYAPGVNAIDPNFTKSELQATIAEAKTLRALCYFYLIRTFRDVPYVTRPSNDDSQNFQLSATSFDVVLDSLIRDVEEVKNYAVRSYGEESVKNTCRITRWACYALLADLYLWKGDWDQCINYCDLVIDEKIRLYEEEYEKNPTTIMMELYGKYPLISEATGSNQNYAGNTYTQIFGQGNSFESIFELVFEDKQSVTNSTVANFYGSNSTQAGQVGVTDFVGVDPYSGDNKLFTKTDCRYLENIYERSNKYYINKYVCPSLSYRTSTTTGGAPTVSRSPRSDNYANWIIYRLTDVMLMRAEALVEKAGDVEEGATPTEEQTALYQDAFDCVMAVWRRANCKRTATTDLLKFEDYSTSRLKMEDLVQDERQRELMFEGKRWFDLVRLCRREGENDRLIQKVLPKFQENTSAIRIKLASDDALFWPYNRDEIKQNPNLKQNPAYVTVNTEQNF